MEVDFKNITVVGFDADDTLWVNETYFRDVEHKFAQLLSAYETENKIDQELFKMEMQNLSTYGYGIKGFMLSMIESAIDLSNGKISNKVISEIIQFIESNQIFIPNKMRNIAFKCTDYFTLLLTDITKKDYQKEKTLLKSYCDEFNK